MSASRGRLARLAASLAPPTAAAAALDQQEVSQGEAVGLLGPLPTTPTPLRPRSEWAAMEKEELWYMALRGTRLPTLEDDFLFHDNDHPCIVPFSCGAGTSRPAVLVMPGGGYSRLGAYEGQLVADWLARRGFVAFVLRYRLAPKHTRQDAENDALAAMRHIRAHSDEYGIDPAHVGAMGFSAGGHLGSVLGLAPADARPDWLGLIYPGVDPRCDDASAAYPPTFLVCSTSDHAVPPENNSDRLAARLSTVGVRHEYVRQELGAHGEMFFLPGLEGRNREGDRWEKTLGEGEYSSFAQAVGFP